MTDLDNEVNNMLKQLQEAEKELKKKQDDADQDMMMAGMVSDIAIGAHGQKGKGISYKKSLFHTDFHFSLCFLVRNWVRNLHRRQRIWMFCQVVAQLSHPKAALS